MTGWMKVEPAPLSVAGAAVVVDNVDVVVGGGPRLVVVEVVVEVTVDAIPEPTTYAPAAATMATTITTAATAVVPTPFLLFSFIFMLPAPRTRYMARRII